MPLNFYKIAYLAVMGLCGVDALFGLLLLVFGPRLKLPDSLMMTRLYGIILVAVAAGGALLIFLGEPRLKYYVP